MGAAVGGAVIGAVSDAIGGFIKINAAKKESKRNRAFQERMYKNRFTYSMEDMRRAGLNPMLAAGMGLGGGGSPSGSMASIPNFSTGGAAEGARVGGQISKIKKEKSLLAAQTAAATQQANASSAIAGKNAAEMNRTNLLTPHEVNSAQRLATEAQIIDEFLKTSAGRGVAIGKMVEGKIPGAGLVGGAMTQTGAQLSKGITSAKGWWADNKQTIIQWIKKELMR